MENIEQGTEGPLHGVRVVDLTTTFMGPYCTMLLARMGADVIKVEAPEGDVVREIGRGVNPGMGPYFMAANHGKRSLAIDLKKQSGRDAMAKVLANADVFLTNIRPAALSRLGLDADTLSAAFPQLIHVALVGFGTGGPYSGRAAYDDVIQAASGIAAVQGNDAPEYVRSVIADKTAGLMALSATVSALYARATTGGGQRVEVPMFETLTSFTLLEALGGHVFEPPRGPTGYSRTSSPHRRPYRTANGYLGVVVYTDHQWKSFFQLVGCSDLMQDERFRTIKRRTENIDQLYAMLSDFLKERTTEEWVSIFEDLGIAAQPVLGPDDLLSDPHLAAVDFFEHIEHPTEGSLRLPRLPVKFNGKTPLLVRGAPALGEHNEEILHAAGMNHAEVQDLTDAGILKSVRTKQTT